MQKPVSEILVALYNRQADEAARLAAAASCLTVWEAAALGETEQLGERLASDPALADAVAPDGFTPLALAAFFGRADCVRVLLDKGADPRIAAVNEMQVQPLHAAVAGRSPEAAQLLLSAGADVNARQQVGYTPLMGAASAGRDDLVDLLLARGADPTLVADDGKTAATAARDHGHPQLADRLDAWTARPDFGPGV